MSTSANGLIDLTFDKRFDEAVELSLLHRNASTSLLQRQLRFGYTRAARLCDQMETAGVVGIDRGNRGREVLLTPELWFKYRNECARARLKMITALKSGKASTRRNGGLNGKCK